MATIERVRIGNDIRLMWQILEGETPVNLANATDIKVSIAQGGIPSCNKIEITTFEVTDAVNGMISVEVQKEVITKLGYLWAVLEYTVPDSGMIDGNRKVTTDNLPVKIVGLTDEASQDSEFTVSSDIQAGFQGKSAYEVWLVENPDKTLQDYFDWLQQPATDVAEDVSQAEALRVQAEQDRVDAETIREQQEADRQTNTATAIADAEEATLNANTAAQNADDARLAIQDDLTEYVQRSFIFDEPVNLLDGIVISRKNIPAAVNEIQDIASVNSRLMVAEIENGETYTVTKFEGGNLFRVATVDTYPDASGSIPTKHKFIDSSITSQERSYTFINTANAKFVVLQSVNNVFSGELPLMQVEKGSVKTEFQEYGKPLKVKEKYLPNDFFEDIGRQPIEGVKKIIGVVFDANNPPSIISGSANVNFVSYRVKLEPFEKITIRRVVGNRFTLATRNTPNPIEYVRGEYYPPQPTDNLIVSNSSLTEYDFVNNGTAVELWMYASGPVAGGIDPEIVEVLFERTESDVVVKDGFRLVADALKEDANYAKKGRTERTLEEVEGIALSNSSVLKRKVSTLYTPKDAVTFPDYPLTPLLDFYAKYDSLMADNPDYIAKQVLGQDSQGNDIVQYTFKPVPMKGTEGRIIPKIGVVSGTHGNEKPADYALYNSLKKIASGWREDKILENFRYNYEFVIIPVVTPSAFIANSRNNINNININRDFPSEAGGSGIGREMETQIVMQFLADNSDIDLFIDFHTDAYYPVTNEYAYLIAWDEKIRDAFARTLTILSAEWRSIHPSVTQDDNVTFTSLRTTPMETTMAYYVHLLDITSGILEVMNTNYISTPVKSEAEITQIMDVEVLVNFINDYFKKI